MFTISEHLLISTTLKVQLRQNVISFAGVDCTRESQISKLLQSIVREPWMSVPDFAAIHPADGEISQPSGGLTQVLTNKTLDKYISSPWFIIKRSEKK